MADESNPPTVRLRFRTSNSRRTGSPRSSAGRAAAMISWSSASSRTGGGSWVLCRMWSGSADAGSRMADRSTPAAFQRSEEHTSELQSRLHLVCRLLLEKKKKKKNHVHVARDSSQTRDSM